MYTVNRITHETYGPVISLDRADDSLSTPFKAVQAAFTEQRLWKEAGIKARLLIDGQIMTHQQAEKWSREEYQSLPKCKTCAEILDGDVYSHSLCDSGLFCSTDCRNKDHFEEMEKLKDETEIDYL